MEKATERELSERFGSLIEALGVIVRNKGFFIYTNDVGEVILHDKLTGETLSFTMIVAQSTDLARSAGHLEEQGIDTSIQIN